MMGFGKEYNNFKKSFKTEPSRKDDVSVVLLNREQESVEVNYIPF